MYGQSFIRLSLGALSRAAIAVDGLFVLLALAAILLCGRLGIHSRKDVTAYQAMIQEHYDPVWKDLAWRRIRKGDLIETVLQRHPPLRREDFPPYTALRYNESGSLSRLAIGAKDGKLISAGAGSHAWTRVFFQSPEEEEAFDTAYSAYVQQRTLETQAFAIHQTIKAGQDVFLARVFNSRGRGYSAEVLRELGEIYGQDYLVSAGMIEAELTVEITAVLHGDLEVGTVLTFPGENCDLGEPGEPEPVFLYVDDMRLLNPQDEARESYSAVPRKALDWYQSLTPDQVKELEAQSLARRGERWQPEELPTRHPRKPKTKPSQQWFHHDSIF